MLCLFKVPPSVLYCSNYSIQHFKGGEEFLIFFNLGNHKVDSVGGAVVKSPTSINFHG